MRDLITKDLGWKIFSVALAIIVWLTVQTIRREIVSGTTPLSATMTRTFEKLPIIVVSAAADVRAVKVNPEFAQVTVNGRPESIRALTGREIHVLVDLTEIEPARDLRKRVDVSAPAGLTITHIVPADVEILIPPKPEASK
jgi:YbbR domain-containing protein